MTNSIDSLIAEIANQTMRYPFKVWGFGEGIALEALWEADSDGRYKTFVLGLMNHWVERPLEEADHSAPGGLLLHAYQETSDERFLLRAIDMAQYMLALPDHACGATFHRPQHADYHDYLYVDCMEVDSPFLCALASILGESEFYDAGVEQLLGYCELLQDEASGLFFHQYNHETDQVNGAFWGRGNGWALLGLMKTLTLLPDSHSKYPIILEKYRQLCNALATLQESDGSWHTVLDDPDTYQETSLPAMFGYGLQMGIREEYLNQSFQPIVEKAWDAMTGNIENGMLSSVSIATPPGNAAHYNRIETSSGFPWGQGPALLFALTKR